MTTVTCSCGKIVDISGQPECIIYGTNDGRQAWWHGCSNPRHPGQALVFGGYCEALLTYSIDGGNQVYLNPEARNLYSWNRESGEPAASFEGRDRLILAVPDNVDPIGLAQWLSEHKAEIEGIIALWDGRRWANGCDEASLAVKRLQDAFDRDFVDGVVIAED